MASSSFKAPKGLLELPGEIRNRIYDQALKGNRDIAVLFRPTPTADNVHTPPDWPVSQRNYVGLAQTCRQIRAEFQPMYTRKMFVLLDPSQVYEYLKLFVFRDRPLESITNAEGSIVMLGDADTRLPKDNYREPATDIAPLIRLRKRSPKFVVEFQSSMGHLDDEVEELLNVDANKSWSKYFDEAIVRVLVQPGFHGMDVELRVRAEFGEPWMITEQTRNFRRYSRQKMEWMKKRGLKFLYTIVNVLVDKE